MEKLCFLVLSAVAATLVSAQTGSNCKMTQEDIEANLMKCLAHEPGLLIQAIEHMKNPQSMVTASFICQNQDAMVDLFFCLEDTYASCYPSTKDMIMQVMPSKDRLLAVVSFMCAHKEELLEKNCMTQSQVQDFMQCYMSKMIGVLQSARADHDIKSAMCSVINSEEQCIQAYHGSCSRVFVDLLFQTLDLLLPNCPLLTIDIKLQKDQAINDASNSILVQGQPLMFQPKENARYNVIEG